MKKDPYQVIKGLHITEKSAMLQGLKNSKANASIRRFENAKYVFLVHQDANKTEIADAVEEIYKEKNVKVLAVNTITLKPKKRRVRGRIGFRPGRKKAIVTLEKGDSLDNI